MFLNVRPFCFLNNVVPKWFQIIPVIVKCRFVSDDEIEALFFSLLDDFHCGQKSPCDAGYLLIQCPGFQSINSAVCPIACQLFFDTM